MSILRRTAAGVLVTFGLLAASLAWWGFSAQRTILDPGRTAATAVRLMETPSFRAAVAGPLAESLARAVPPGVRLDPDVTRAAAEAALSDPRFTAAYGDALTALHARLVGAGPDDGAPVTLDTTAVGAAARDALVAAQPELAGVLPAVPPVEVTLPASRLPDLSGPAREVPDATGTAALAAAALLGAGLLISSRRGRTLARVGRGAAFLGAGQVAFGFLLPGVADSLGGTTGPLLGALARTITAGLVGPASVMVAIGVAAWLAGRAWDKAAPVSLPAPPRIAPPPHPYPA